MDLAAVSVGSKSMTWRVSGSFIRLFIGLVLCAASAHSLAKCNFENEIDAPTTTAFLLKAGDQRLVLSCNVDAQYVLYFPRNYINYNHIMSQ